MFNNGIRRQVGVLFNKSDGKFLQVCMGVYPVLSFQDGGSDTYLR